MAYMNLLQATDPVFLLTLPRRWFRSTDQARLPERLSLTIELLVGGNTLRLLGTPARPTDPVLDFTGRLLKDGSPDQGKGRLRWPGGEAPVSVEATQTLDGSYQLQRSGLRGTLPLAKNSKLLYPEAALWFSLGRLLKLGGGEQALTLVREGDKPELLSGTLFLTEERSEPLKLRDTEVMARRFRYRTAGLGYPKERERGTLWIGPEGEVLRSDLLPRLLATGPLAVEKGSPAYLLPTAEGTVLRAQQGSEGWTLSETLPGKPLPRFTAELDFDYRLRRFTSNLTAATLSAEWESGELRFAYPSLPPNFVRPAPGGVTLFLASLLLPEPLPGLAFAVGEKRAVLVLPLFTGEELALDGTLQRLPDTARKTRRYQLTLPDSITAELEYDSLGLVRLTSSGPLAITRR